MSTHTASRGFAAFSKVGQTCITPPYRFCLRWAERAWPGPHTDKLRPRLASRAHLTPRFTSPPTRAPAKGLG